MEKKSKNSLVNDDDVVNVSKIYETIQDKGFIQDLWLDVMSDIKEKPSYARMKNMVDKVIGGAVENYATKPKDHEERLKTRTIFSELSIMTYTIDTLISEILHKKLKDEFKSIIGNILEELKKKQISLEVEKNNESMDMLEDIGELLCNGSSKGRRNLADVSDEDTISVDECSTRSDVSSVHTSDLSSFEDNISISSEDEDGTKTTKHVSLKLANDLYANGRITKLYEICKKKSNSNGSQTCAKFLLQAAPKVVSSKKSKGSKSIEDSPNKRLPARNRKPNSKYSSSDVICPIKLLLPSSESASDKIDVDENDDNLKMESSRQKLKAKRERAYKVPYDINRVTKIIGSPPSTSKIVFAKKTDVHANINEVEVKKKRGRPSNKTSSGEDEKTTSKSAAQILGEDLIKKSDTNEIKRKRGRPLNKSLVAMEDSEQTNVNKTTSQDYSINKKNEDQVKHSVESFSILEEQLCLKDQKTIPASPPKSSTKSYEKSDLYKPHSDFRVFNSRGSRAFTLFSN